MSIDFSLIEVALYYSVRVPELVQRGRQWRGPCPIHHGDGLSFSVDPETGRSYCFSQCGRGWDIVGFECEFSGVGFREAVEAIGAIVGRSLLADSLESPQPKYSGEQLAVGELFRVGLAWRIERDLEIVKGELLGPRHKDAVAAMRRLTEHHEWIQRCTPSEAVAAVECLNPELVHQCIWEAREAQLEIAASLVALSGQTERAA
jgi:hypothetical protein